VAAKKDPPVDFVALAFDELAERGWRQFSLMGVAERAGRPLSDVHAQIRSRGDLWRAMADRLDQATFAIEVGELGPLSARERLFELIMRRLDALEAYRPALQRISQERIREPELAAIVLCNLDRFAERLLDTCGSTLGGLRRRAARRLLMLAYGRVFWVWLGDTSEDRASTMAELDKRLGQLDRLARWSARPARRRPANEPPANDTAAVDEG